MAIKPNPTRDAILDQLLRHPTIRLHPQETPPSGRQYICAFQCPNGRTLALDKSAMSKQPIWIPDDPRARAMIAGQGLAFDVYPPEKGRNSNLKFSEFRDKAVLRAYPTTVRDALSLAEALAAL